MRRVLFVCRTLAGEALRCAKAIADLEEVELLTTCVDDAQQLIEAATAHGRVRKIVTAQETLLAAVAEANEFLGLDAMKPEVVSRTLDKSQLKSTLERAGIKTPRAQVVTTVADALRFVDEIGFPIVIKPANGSGALATFRITTEEELTSILNLIDRPVIAQEYVHGQEICFDTVTIANEPQCYAVCFYKPSIIEALENPHKQWRCVMLREIEPYAALVREGLAAVGALKVGNAITHMEGFVSSAGPAGFFDATLRPAGARIGPMFGYAFDVDPYRLWARVAVDGAFDGPLERKYAVGTIFLRGAGSGSVESVEGAEAITNELRDLIVEACWPTTGASRSATYTGDGFITLRHADVTVVENALDFMDRTIHINYSSSQPSPTMWRERLLNFKQLNRPAWDHAAS